MKKIILISGKAGSGKDLCASLLEGWNRIGFADILKDQVAEKYGIDRQTFDTQRGKMAINHLGITNRSLLIEHGSSKRKIDENYWVSCLDVSLNKSKESHFVIPDFRFPNEYDYLSKSYNIRTLRVSRSEHISIDDPSETSLTDFKFDYNIDNNSTIEKLKEKIDTINIEFKS